MKSGLVAFLPSSTSYLVKLGTTSSLEVRLCNILDSRLRTLDPGLFSLDAFAAQAAVRGLTQWCPFGNQETDCAVVLAQVGLRHPLYICRGGGAYARHDLENQRPVSQRGVLANLQSAEEERVLPIDECGFE